MLIITLIKKDVEGRLAVSEPYLWLLSSPLSDKQITNMFLPSINQEGEDGHYVLGCGLDHMSRGSLRCWGGHRSVNRRNACKN